MLKNYAQRYVYVAGALRNEAWRFHVGHPGYSRNKPLASERREFLAELMKGALELVSELGAEGIEPLIERTRDALKDSTYDGHRAYQDLVDLESRIYDYLGSMHFLLVEQSKLGYYSGPALFGEEVNDLFPRAIDDIADAGKAIALGLGTAAVMHLMRVMEDGLRALAKGLKIPYAPSWESYLLQIQTRIAAKPKTKGVRWKRDEKYYRDITGDLLTVKQAWRNPTMHIDRRYTVEEAEEIFKAVRSLMQHLAKPRA